MSRADGMPVQAEWHGEDPMVIVCAGPPACVLQGDAAIDHQNAGCLMCRRIVVTEDGEHALPAPTKGTA